MIESAIARHLADTVDGLVYDESGATGNLFLGYMPSEPDVAVMVSIPAAQPQLSNLPYDLPQPQVLVRAGRFDVRGVDALARAVYAELTCLDLTTIAEGTPDEVFVVGATAIQSFPVDIGVDDNERPQRSLNFNFHVPSPTTHRQQVGA